MRDYNNNIAKKEWVLYNNIKDGIYETTEFLEKFLRNLLLDEKMSCTIEKYM